jgi:1-acyl-sn-glycerol-3-phosphate acyltransferase
VLGLFLVILAPTAASPSSRFFLTGRHVCDTIARRDLLAGAGQALLTAVAIALVVSQAPAAGEAPAKNLMRFGGAFVVGALAVGWQRYPQRAIAFTPVGWGLAAVGFLGAWIAPGTTWSLIVLGFGLGLGHTPPRSDLLACLPDSQRAAGLGLMAAAMGVGAAVGIALVFAVPAAAAAPAWLAVAAILTALAVHGYLRELVEQITELPLSICYRIRAYGPGRKIVPTRGPMLVLANHCAYLDPLWVAKVIPIRMRPMMTSKFYDKRGISWLMRYVFNTIRVPETTFRREAPEIQDAIAGLERGETVLIFPEGWLKRKEEQTIRRFGQGIYQILREKPTTPVVVCWIEGGWGSYMSYAKGPPMVNKRLDFRRPIRIGISEPEVLSLDLLHDGLATRRHLMQACMHARTYLGLPELPAPPFAQAEESEESPETAS